MNSLFRYFTSCGARNDFEKARIQATYEGDTEPPQENDLSRILNVLKGEDEEQTSQDAFSAIIQQIKTGKLSWVKAMKILILLDRAVNQLLLLKTILQVNLQRVEEYQPNTPEEQHLLIDLLIQYYYKYIKLKSFHYQKQNLSLLIPRREKIIFFDSLDPIDIIKDLQISLELMEYAIELAYTDQRGHLKYRINQYVFLLLLQDLLNICSSLLIGINNMTNRIQQLSTELIEALRKIITSYNILYDKMEFFIGSHPYIDGFAEVNLNQFKKIDLDEILKQYYQLFKDEQISQGDTKEIILANQEDIMFETRVLKRHNTVFAEPNKPSKEKFDSRVEKLRKFPQRCFAGFDEMIFINFENNFCSDYRPIMDQDNQYDHNEFVEDEQRQLVPVLSVLNIQTTQTQRPIITTQEFDEELFQNHQNLFCYEKMNLNYDKMSPFEK